MSEKTDDIFEMGETVWYYPLGKEKPLYREKVVILEVHEDGDHRWYRVKPTEETMFPTFVGPSVLEKVMLR